MTSDWWVEFWWGQSDGGRIGEPVQRLGHGSVLSRRSGPSESLSSTSESKPERQLHNQT